MVAILGPAYFETGQPMLEAACMNIAQWIAPDDGKVLDLPFLGRLLQVELPTPLKPQLLETTPFDMNKLKPDIQVNRSRLSYMRSSQILITVRWNRLWRHYL